MYHFIMSASLTVIVSILYLSCSSYLQFLTTKTFKRLQTYITMLLPGFVVDLLLMSTDQFCIPTLEYAS